MKNCRLGPESEQRIDEAIEKFTLNMPGSDIEDFMHALEANNIEVSMNYDLSKLREDLVALIVFGDSEEEGKKASTIYLDNDIDGFNLFFYIAHEAGHHMMHYQSGGEVAQYRSREKSYVEEYEKLPPEEKEAEFFAYKLLMPAKPFCRAYYKLEDIHKGDVKKIVSDLSKLFYSGELFVEKRLEYLELV